MRLYTIHDRPGHDRPTGRAGRAPRTRLVREGFSLWAFLFAPVWLAMKGLWLALLGYVAAAVALGFIVPEVLAPLAAFAFQLLFALHARDLERWTLRRRGYVLRGVVAGTDTEDALLRTLTAHPDLGPGAVA